MRFSKVRFGKFGIYPVRSTTDLSAHQHLEAKHLCLSNNISVKPLPQSFYLDIYAKRSLPEIFC